MFNKQEYINDFIKENYKSIKLRIRNDNKVVLYKLNEVENVNKYLISLILKDIHENRKFHFINNEIVIDFDVSKTMQYLIDEAEYADLINDYGLYMNIADAIDTQAKKETSKHLLRESEWRKLVRRYSV